MADRICFCLYCYALPHRWQFTRLGYWLLERAGRYAYDDAARQKEAKNVDE